MRAPSDPPRKWLGPLWAISAGAVWAAMFGRHGYLLAPWLALVPLLLLLALPRAGRWSFLAAMASWLVAIPWIAPTLVTFGNLGAVLGVLGLLLLAAILGAYSALFAVLAAPLWRDGRAFVVLAGVPSAWVVAEWLRGHLFSGFPWNLAAYSFLEVPGALALSSWVGAYGVTALVVFANTGVALAVARRKLAPALLSVSVTLLLLAAASQWARPAPTLAAGSPVRLLQPNIENMVFFDAAQARQSYEKVLAMSRQACDREGGLLLWPESAAWPFRVQDSELLRRDLASLNAAGCSVLLNSPHQEQDGRWFNSALLVGEGGEPRRYDKGHLVPWGEYVPLGGLIPFYDRLARNAGDFSAAEEVALLDWQRERLGLAICYEVVFPEEVAARVGRGATALVSLTNDAWYGDTWAPWQHLAAARFRAAETSRPLLRAAITGVSAVIGPDGRLQASLGVGQEGVLATDLAGRTERTPFVRWPHAAPLLCALLLAAIFLVHRLTHRRTTLTP